MQEKIRTYKDGFGFVESVNFTNSGLSFIDFFVIVLMRNLIDDVTKYKPIQVLNKVG